MTRGGKRKGAGRPATGSRYIKVLILLLPEQVKRVRQQATAKDISFNARIREMIG